MVTTRHKEIIMQKLPRSIIIFRFISFLFCYIIFAEIILHCHQVIEPFGGLAWSGEKLNEVEI
jgi:hypothetical protein